ncbi:MAG TPA: efflux RND transporter periplasmic adaptor subunit [Chitinophagaceae bacterium]|nr:efflux RND transporter periplasmic adaptor subunit [Chitinophagaceae bacterium]
MKKIIYLLPAMFFLSCSSSDETEYEQAVSDENMVLLTKEQISYAGIRTDTIRVETLHTELLVNGQADVPPQNIVSVSFPLGGYLKTTSLLPGMKVARGQVIAVMEDQALVQLQQDYLVAANRLAYLEQEQERQRVLHEGQANAGKVFQQAQSDFRTQQILLKGYEEKLKLAGIQPDRLTAERISRSVPVYAPISGYVSKVNVNIGKYVNPADVLFELINPSDIHAALTIFEKDIQKIKTGQRVWVSFVNEPGKEYECEVLLITRNVDDSRSAEVHCHFEKQPDKLLPGMFLRARIQLDSIRAAAVPEEALVRYGAKNFIVLQEEEGQYRLTEAEPGTRTGGLVELKGNAGIFAGRQVVIKNAYTILGKMKNTAGED